MLSRLSRTLRACSCVSLFACTSASRPHHASTDAGSRDHADATMASQCNSNAQVICDASQVSSIPAGDSVTVAAGIGDPPVPTFGTLVDGSYQLIAETLYGAAPFDESPSLGDVKTAVLSVHCDTYNESYTAISQRFGDAKPGSSANGCGRFAAKTLTLPEVSGLQADGGDRWMDEVMYSGNGDTLTLIFLEPYRDYAKNLVGGSYTVVEQFARVGTGSYDAGAAPAADAGVVSPSQARDPRCPKAAPAQGERCDPNPAPLQCEYDGDAFARCTTFGICALQADGTFRFEVSRGTNCDPNAEACPASFGTASDGSSMLSGDNSCAKSGLTCNYAEGVCGCVAAFSGPDAGPSHAVLSWRCKARAQVPASPADASCPAQRPLAGDGCAADHEACNYDAPCDPELSLGPTMICRNGYWEAQDSRFFCPAKPAL
jgi:hypothetical protein